VRIGPYGAIAIWILAVLASIILIARTELTTDMSAFLPRSPGSVQQALVDQVREGVASRLVLLAIEGAPTSTLAELSRNFAARLRGNPRFVLVNNGAVAEPDRDREFLWRNRYLLSPGVTQERFTPVGLRRALEIDLRLLGSDLAPLVKWSLARDPTSEFLTLIETMAGDTWPATLDSVWFSPDGSRALLLVQTAAAGFDIDAQRRNLQLIDDTFAAARAAIANSERTRLLETGQSVFAVRSRAEIKRDATRFSILASVLVAGLLLFAYRSPRMLVLGFLPVASGALAGLAAVSLHFGSVHGITIGFGVTLIGEAVDYPIYLFTQTIPGCSVEATLRRISSTLLLGMTTSTFGFSAMLFSSFTGFAQLGLFSIAGLVAAFGMTRWVLPGLLPAGFAIEASADFAAPLVAIGCYARQLRVPILLFVALAFASLLLHAGAFWQESLGSLSPIPPEQQRLDQRLRADLNAPDMRDLILVTARDLEDALATSERLGAVLSSLVREGVLAGFDAPDRYLPSAATQRSRKEAIPNEAELRVTLQEVLRELPFRAQFFDPFLAEAAAARTAPLLRRASLEGTSFTLRLDSLLSRQNGAWVAMLPLRGVVAPDRLAVAIAGLGEKSVAIVDLKVEADRVLAIYLREALLLSLTGGIAIVILLAASLRSPARVARVLIPLAASVILTVTILTIGDRQLSIFNLVGLLLTVAIGSNYALFFERQQPGANDYKRTLASVSLANLCTVIGFGVLALSDIPVLRGIGSTVAIGAALALCFSIVFTARR
jgi:predicted exporter